MNQNDIDTFLKEQRAHHQAHLDEVRAGHISDIVPPPTFEEWLAAMYLEQKDVLRELWNKLVECDLNTLLEETAQANSREEWETVLGIMEAVRLALGEDMPIRAFT